MQNANLPVTSREYKLILNTERFKNPAEGCIAFTKLLSFLITQKFDGRITNDQTGKDEEIRLTYYLDTKDSALRREGLVLRVREEENDKFKTTLKCRTSDRYIASALDVTSPRQKERKFEEDIVPPFVSKFSHSSSIKNGSLPDLSTIDKVAELFPGLKNLSLDGTLPVNVVNGFKAFEVVRKTGIFRFGQDDLDVKSNLSFWYFQGKEDTWPLVGEFSFDYDISDQVKEATSRAKQAILEEYPKQTVEGSNRLFAALQSHAGWFNFNIINKTAFALEVL